MVPLFTALLLTLLALPVACSGSDTPTDMPGSDSTTPNVTRLLDAMQAHPGV